jgi:hypothetical protein
MSAQCAEKLRLIEVYKATMALNRQPAPPSPARSSHAAGPRTAWVK